MADIITEALLEMHFHRALVAHFEKLHGSKFLKLFKPSTKDEAWVGFDQGWVHTSMGTKELFEELKKTIHSAGKRVDKFYIGYFLQYKKVEWMQRDSKYMPSDFPLPYFRCELSLKPNNTTGLSQHETLRRLVGIKNASVSYACPMFFELDDIYKKADIADLRMVPVKGSPKEWSSDERHFICFRNTKDPNPKWRSDPVTARSYSVGEWSSHGNEDRPMVMSGKDVFDLIMQAEKLIYQAMEKRFIEGESRIQALPESLTFIELQRESASKKST